jgi:hypothetical protein
MGDSARSLRVFRGAGDLSALASVLEDSRLSWCYGERMEGITLDWLADVLDEGSETVGRFEVGRAFGADLELDWWKTESGFRLRALLEDGDPPAGVEWEQALTLDSGGKHQLVLWGDYDDDLGAWAENRIPRSLPFPVRWSASPPDRVALEVCDYCRDGAVVLTRFLAVVEYEREQYGK